MDLDGLRNLTFTQLDDAIDDWEKMTGDLKRLAGDARDNLKKKADKANWTGVNATVTREFVDKTAGEFTDAHTQADTTTKILKDTRGELAAHQKRLHTVIEAGTQNNLIVVDTGDGTFNVTPAPTTDPDGAAQKAHDLRDQIQRILTKATESDKTASQALRAIVDQAKYGFSDVSYENRDEAANALAAAAKAEKILKQNPQDVSNTELSSLNNILAKYKNDPLFAEKIATDVGAKKTLEFYGQITDDSQFAVNPRSGKGLSDEQKTRRELLGGLEKQLGTTLATASHSDSDGMQQWKRDVIALGGTNVRPNGEHQVYGFQVMSNLMRQGNYESNFLHDYGNSLISYEKEHTSNEYGGLQRRVTREDVLPWDRAGQYERLHYGAGNDAGEDPMTGFMEALGHNSEASTDFFNEGKNFDYLAEDREWPKDFAEAHAKGIAGYDSLGHALESATTGSAYDAHPPALHRNEDTAKVADKVVTLYGQPAEGTEEKRTQLSGAELMKKQDGIQDSLSRIGASYIDDINWGLDDDDKRSVFAQDGTGRTPDQRAHFQASDVRGFLGTLGQDPEAYTRIGLAQQVYTTSVLDSHPPFIDDNGEVHSAAAETAVSTGAEVQGIIDQSRADQSEAEGAAKEKEYNEKMDKHMKNQQAIAGAIVGGAFSLLPEADSGAAAVLVPIATDNTEEQISSRIEDNLEKYGENQHRQLVDVRQGQSKRIYDAGFLSSWEPGRKVLAGLDDGTWRGDSYYEVRENLKNAQETGYNSGSHAQQQAGNLPVTE